VTDDTTLLREILQEVDAELQAEEVAASAKCRLAVHSHAWWNSKQLLTPKFGAKQSRR
jgi:hypothetical protein